jgi:hypothetical protein
VMVAVNSVITTYAVVIAIKPLSRSYFRSGESWLQRTRRSTIVRVMVLVSFAAESLMDAVIFLTTPVRKR